MGFLKGGKGFFDPAKYLPANAGGFGYARPDDSELFGGVFGSPVATPGIGDGIPGNQQAGTYGHIHGVTGTKPQGGERRHHTGFFGRLGDMARTGQLAYMLAAVAGDQQGMANAQRMMTMRQHRQEAEQEAQQRRSLFNNLTKQGMSAGAAEIAMTDPESLAREFNSRFRTREGAPGTGFVTPGFGDAAPSTFRIPTTAEQHAAAAGLQPGTPEYQRFIQDAELQAQGPTGTETTRRGQDITERDSIRSTGVSEGNSIRSQQGADRRHNTPAARPPGQGEQAIYADIMRRHLAGQPVSPAESQWVHAYELRHGGRAPQGRSRARPGRMGVRPNEAMARDAQGRPLVVRNGQWVPAGR